MKERRGGVRKGELDGDGLAEVVDREEVPVVALDLRLRKGRAQVDRAHN
jgi:hypothetical protein